jgi:hypothetical protein
MDLMHTVRDRKLSLWQSAVEEVAGRANLDLAAVPNRTSRGDNRARDSFGGDWTTVGRIAVVANSPAADRWAPQARRRGPSL